MQIKFLSLILILVLSLSTTFYASTDENATPDSENRRIVKVAFPIVKGFTEIDENGTRSGIVVDYLMEISKYTNWKYEFIPTDLSSMTDDFAAGKFDIMGGVYYNEALKDLWLYPDYTTGSSRSTLIASNDDYSIKSYDLSTLNNKTIGVYEKATESIRRLKEFLSANNIQCSLKYYKLEDFGEDGTLHHHLTSGEVDLLLANTTESGDDFHIVTTFKSQSHYIVVQPDDPGLLEELNCALEKILESNPDFPDECYNKNFPDCAVCDIQLSPSELQYIESKQTVTVAIVNNFHPLFCLNTDKSSHNGIIPDILQEISSFTNLNFEYVYAYTYIDAINLVKEGKADILGFFLGSENDAYEMELSLSTPYAYINKIVMKNKSVDYPGESLKGGVLDGERLPDNIKVSDVSYYSTVSDALEAVNNGDVDFLYGLSTYLEFEVQKQYYSNVVPATPINNNSDICFALPRPVDSQLLTIINKAINHITTNDKTTIENRNMVSSGMSDFSLSKIIYNNPVGFVFVCASILIVFLILFLIGTHYRIHNLALKNKLKARSSFLSRMSHEIRTPLNAIIGLTELTCKMEALPCDAKDNINKINSSSQYLLSLIDNILDMSTINNKMLTLKPTTFALSSTIEAIKDIGTSLAAEKNIDFSIDFSVSHDIFYGDYVRLQQVIMNLVSNAVKFTNANGYVKLTINEVMNTLNSSTIMFSVEDNGIGIPLKKQKIVFEAFEQADNKYSRIEGTGLGLAISQALINLMGGNLCLKSEEGKGSLFYFTITLRHDILPEIQPVDTKQFSFDGMHILLAEDNDLNAEIAIKLLENKAASVDRAVDGVEAVDTFINNTPYTYNLILMDLSMPNMDGLEAAKKIRSSRKEDASDIPIIAITANSFKEDVNAAYKSGMNGFISKPFNTEELYNAITSNINKKI